MLFGIIGGAVWFISSSAIAIKIIIIRHSCVMKISHNTMGRCSLEWPCNTPSEDSSKSKTNTTTGKTMLKLVKIQSLRKIGIILMK
jgi:hypothetical protein